MPTPFSPDPARRSDAPSSDAAKVASTQNQSEADHDPNALTGSVESQTPEPPTVISAVRARNKAFDAKISAALAGKKLGHFELIETVGAGGMAAVLRARDLDLGRIVALKILPPDMAADPENIIRFKQEARAAAKLDHDNVARVYFFGEDQGLHFIAFEFVEGDNLRQLMDANGGIIPVADAVALMLQVTAGLAHAAERGVVHRDIKPSNIIVTPDGKAKIVDMGLARSLDSRAGQLTESGVTLGTFDYISPEQAIEPRSADVRSDIYSLGCTFYHALTGHPPVPEGTAAKKLDAQKNLMPPDPRGYNPAISADLAAVLGRMMAKDPDRRYQHPDHLSAHLRSVARKLGIPTGPLPAHGPAFEDPIPPPPRISAAWMLTAVAVMALAVAIFLNTTGNGRLLGPQVPSNSGKVGPEPTDPGDSTAVAVGARDAANTEEFVSLLRQGATNIRLTGAEYDLVNYRDRNDGYPVEAVMTGDDVRLEGVAGTTVKMDYMPTDGKTRLKTMTLRGPGRGKAHVRKVRFVLPKKDGHSGESGLAINGFDRVTVEECTFTPTAANIGQDGPAALAVDLHGGIANFFKCYFAPGCVGVEVNGPGQVTAGECAIAPQRAGVRVTRSPNDSVGETELSLSHCTAMLTTIGGAAGAVVEVDDSVPCVVRAGHCLFAGPDRSLVDDAPVVLRQRKTRSTQTKYQGEGENRPNHYYHIAAYADGDGTYTFAEAARENLPVSDVERPIKHPWRDRNPIASLIDGRPSDPLAAFKQDLRLEELRIKEDPKGSLIGAQFIGSDRLYPIPLPSSEDSRDATVKVWDPSLSDTATDLPPGVFPTLDKALAAVRSGDTLLIRYNGKLDIDERELKKKNDTNLTIKADKGYKPVLVPATAAFKRPQCMFKLYGGKLVLDGLHFRLPADRAPAVAVLPGGGQLEIRNAVITLEDGEDMAAVTFTDPRGEMMMMGGGTSAPINWPVPKVTLENVFIRGKGHLLNVKGSRPFELDVKNVLAAVDDTLIDIDPSTADPSSAGSGVIRLSRTTAYLGGSLLHIRAGDRKGEMGPAGLARTEVTANGCVFVPAGAADSFVRADRIDTREQAEKWLTWRGKGNVYGYDKKKVMLELRPADIEAAMIKLIEGDRWLEMTLEPADPDPFAAVRFRFGDGLPVAKNPAKFFAVRPNDFGPAQFDPVRPEGLAEVGAPTEVPAPFPDE